MRIKINDILICIDEICSIANVYISSSIMSVIERFENNSPFVAFYTSKNEKAVKTAESVYSYQDIDVTI